jgi:hypothetical protein
MKRLGAWWFAPAPAERLAALRIIVGGFALVYLLVRLPELVGVSRYDSLQFHPYGVVRVLSAPLPPALVVAIAAATCVLLALFVLGAYYRVVAPLAAVALLWTITYRNCWGMPFHTENLMVLHVIALAIAPAADVWAVGTRGRAPAVTAGAGYGWAVKLLAALTVATYLLAGIAKLRIAGLGWIDGEQLRNHIAIDNLRKALLGDGLGPLAHLVLEHPSPLLVFSIASLAIELGAPLALLHRRIGQAWVIGAWGFHVGVVLLMNIWFIYPLAAVAFLPLVPAERVILGALGIVRRARRS